MLDHSKSAILQVHVTKCVAEEPHTPTQNIHLLMPAKTEALLPTKRSICQASEDI